MKFQPIETAPRDGTPVLLLIKSAEHLPERCGDLADIQFVGRCRTEWGEGMGWNFAAPVGYGGISDEWLAGWMPLPPKDTD